jgi:hypothetical protein
MEQYIREKIDPTVGQKLTEAAELRKQFEPLAGVEGLSDIEPEALGELVEFHKIASDPQAFTDWFTQVAQRSAQEDPEAFEEWWAQIGRENDWLDDGDEEESGNGDDADLLREQITALEERLAGFEQNQTQAQAQQEQQARIAERSDLIEQQLSEVIPKLGELDDEAKEQVRNDLIRMAMPYAEEHPDDSIPMAFQDYLRIKGIGESELVDSKLNQPDGALPRGRAADTREPITMENAKDIAKAQFRNRVGAGT